MALPSDCVDSLELSKVFFFFFLHRASQVQVLKFPTLIHLSKISNLTQSKQNLGQTIRCGSFDPSSTMM